MSLAVTPGGRTSVDDRAHVLRLVLNQCLRRQYVLDFGRADAVGERAESAMRAGVAVAANQRHARQREALLGSDNVDDALALIELVEIFEAEQFGVVGETGDLLLAFRIGIFLPPVGRRHVMVDHAERLVRRAHLASGQPQAFERLRARHLMDEMPVDIDKSGPVRVLVDEMIFPDFVVERSRLRHGLLRRFLLGGRRPGCGAAVILPLDNARRLAAPAAQIIKLGAAHLAAA